MNTYRLFVRSCLCVLAFAVVFGGSLANADDPEEKEYSGRLPNKFSKLGLFYKQKQEIYQIQSEYDRRIIALQKQIDDLEMERDIRVYGVLDDRQKDYLKELLAKDPNYFQDVVEAAEKQPATKVEESDGAKPDVSEEPVDE